MDLLREPLVLAHPFVVDGVQPVGVYFTVLVGQGARTLRADELDDDLLEQRLVRTVVVRIQRELHVGTGVPLRQPVGEVGHAVFRFRPFRAETLHLPPWHGRRRDEGNDIGQVGAGSLGLYLEGQIVHRADAHLLHVRQFTLVEGPPVPDHVVEKGVDVPAGRIQHAAEGVLEVVGRNVPAVAPPRAFPEMEGPCPAVLRRLPTVRRGRHQLVVLVQQYQPFEGEVRAVGLVGRHADVQRGRLAEHVSEPLLVRRGRVVRELASNGIDPGLAAGPGTVFVAGAAVQTEDRQGQ